ncbi:MAG: hypothetical protein ACPGTS_01375, partial [Minisyncoccia bacterium]
ISELPDNIRNAVETLDWATEILHIAHDHHIQIDDIETFRRETLLVIVGLTDAADFEKNLVKNMGISHDLADALVADANAHIFRPLQKIAFTKTETTPEPEPDIPAHHEISNELQNHGIELVDEHTPTKPQNDLQKIVDATFNNNIQTIHTENPEATETPTQQKPEPKPVHYREPIQTSDLQGIKGHRTNIQSPARQTQEKILHNTQRLEKKLFEQTHLSKNERFDVSPTEAENISERGDFLKHIGAIPAEQD